MFKSAEKSQRTEDIENVLQLPILKHFDTNEIATVSEKWKPGEVGVLFGVAAFLAAGVGYVSWKLILPALLSLLGTLFSSMIFVFVLVLGVLAAPFLYTILRRLTRYVHKLLIRHDPFAELEAQRRKMQENRDKFGEAQGKIRKLKDDMMREAKKSEQEAQQYKESVLKLQEKAEEAKLKMEEIVEKKGAAGKDTDQYVDLHSRLVRSLSEAERISHLLHQSNGFAQKYGVRANVMGKLDRKLTMVETALDIKISDFDASIDMLKKEHAFAAASKSASEQAKSVMMFTEGWEVDYAMDVVTNTIAMDLALTQENLSDIDALTSQYSMNSDELYAKLDSLADKIKTGNYEITNPVKYGNTEYKLTEDDQVKGGFGDLF